MKGHLAHKFRGETPPCARRHNRGHLLNSTQCTDRLLPDLRISMQHSQKALDNHSDSSGHGVCSFHGRWCWVFSFNLPSRGLAWPEVLINNYFSMETAAVGSAPWATAPLAAFRALGDGGSRAGTARSHSHRRDTAYITAFPPADTSHPYFPLQSGDLHR